MADVYSFSNGDLFLRIVFYTEKTHRVIYSAHPSPRLTDVAELAPEPETGGISRIDETPSEYRISTEIMSITVDKRTLEIKYEDKNGAGVSCVRGIPRC